MLISAIFSVLLTTMANGLNNCDDCTNLNECTQAMDAVNNNYNDEVQNKLKEAQCGDILADFQICCSYFNDINEESETEKEDEIENHPNIHLLPDECGILEGDRIIGGQIASLYEYPWIVLVSLRSNNVSKFDCGGTVISARYVLTAAHCIKGHTVDIVRVGEYDTSTTIDCYGIRRWRVCESTIQDIAVKNSIIHPNYTRIPEILNDIGLLHLQKPVDFSVKNAGAVCLPVFQNLREMSLAGEIGIVAGWGKTETGRKSDVLLKVEVPIHSTDTCKDTLKSYVKSVHTSKLFINTLCAGELGADSCQGDSGGPLMVQGEYNETFKVIQYGIVSFGIGCGQARPAIYTDVRMFMKWILDTIEP